MDSITPDHERQISDGVRFLQSLFTPSDCICFRPVETWNEASKKRSRVDYKGVRYWRGGMKGGDGQWVWAPSGTPVGLDTRLTEMKTRAEQERTNVIFGVCARHGATKYDQAWQIRTVRVLWADIDNVSVDEALERCPAAGLPPPSIVINSGHGAHLYWLLVEPYLIDDVGDPVPVETEWTQMPGGSKKPRKYIVENGDKVYLDKRRHVSRLSPKAEHIQDVLAGIARALGGDHTNDLVRLLRVPGTLNRKDERNGRKPVPCTLIECDSTREYPLSTFEPLKSASVESGRAKKIAAMPLPKPRNKISSSKADTLADLIAASSIAPVGARSEADFAVCCDAIRNGLSKEEVWTQVEQVGKFAEQGRRYFDLTWENAEYDVRASKLDKLEKRTAPKGPQRPVRSDEVFGDDAGDLDQSVGGRFTIRVDPQTMQVGDTLHQVTD